MATLTTLARFPALMNLRCGAHSRTWAFQAMSLIGCGRLSLPARIWAPIRAGTIADQPIKRTLPRRSRNRRNHQRFLKAMSAPAAKPRPSKLAGHLENAGLNNITPIPGRLGNLGYGK